MPAIVHLLLSFDNLEIPKYIQITDFLKDMTGFCCFAEPFIFYQQEISANDTWEKSGSGTAGI